MNLAKNDKNCRVVLLFTKTIKDTDKKLQIKGMMIRLGLSLNSVPTEMQFFKH